MIPNQDFNLFDLPTDVFCAIINVQPIDISSMMDSSTNFHGKASFLDRLKQVSDALRMDIEYFNVDEKMTYNEMRSYKVKLNGLISKLQNVFSYIMTQAHLRFYQAVLED